MATGPKEKDMQLRDQPSVVAGNWRCNEEMIPRDGVDPRRQKTKEMSEDSISSSHGDTE
jgi:hypothetical protein